MDSALWVELLVAGTVLAGLGVGAMFLLALSRLAGPSWDTPRRTLLVTLTRGIPVAAMLMLIVVAWRPVGDHQLLPTRAVLSSLSDPWPIVRTVAYFSIWLGYAGLFARIGAWPRLANTVAATYLIVSAVTFWFASVDWLATLHVGWINPALGVYLYVGFVDSVLAVLLLTKAGEHASRHDRAPAARHDLQNMVFGFSCVWVYLWYCQYMLVWYANIPSETNWFVQRLAPGWNFAFWAVLITRWVVPFILLLPRPGQRRRSTLWVAATSVLCGQWLDVYMLAAPSIMPSANFRHWELLFPALTAVVLTTSLGRA